MILIRQHPSFLQLIPQLTQYRGAVRLFGSSEQHQQFNEKSEGSKHLTDEEFDELRPRARSRVNSASEALARKIPSRILAFELGVDDAIERFEQQQAMRAKGMQAHNLLSKGSNARVLSAYIPFWAFSCTVTAEYKGMLGYKDQGTGMTGWREMEDWRTLGSKMKLTAEEHPFLQVYASYRYEREVGEGAFVPVSSPAMSRARPLSAEEAASLMGPAGAAGHPSARLAPGQLGMAVRQEPVVQWSRVGPHRQEQEEGGSHNHSHSSSSQQSGPEPGPSGSNSDKTASSHAQGAGAQQGRTTGGGGTCDSVIIHPPDMQLPVAWQLAYRGIMRHVAEAAAHQAKSESGATEAKEFHVVLRFHTRSAQLLYLPVYVAHYEHGKRYKHGTSSIIVPAMYHAAMGGTREGAVAAPLHVSALKAAGVAGGVVGGAGLLAVSTAAPFLGFNALIGSAEVVVAAIISASLAGMWAHGLTQSLRNDKVAEQMRIERQFYREYDARETKTAASVAAAAGYHYMSTGGTQPAAGDPLGSMLHPNLEKGEAADEYMQWLWMDNDWRRWEADEPWNWEEQSRWAAAEDIARRTAERRIARQKFLERLLEERERREQEFEQEVQRMRGLGGGARARARARRPPAGMFAGLGSPESSTRRDFLGYYQVLGLAGQQGEVMTEEIKAAFKARALVLHPDRAAATGKELTVEGQKEAHAQFHRLQMAYDVLRDPEKRRAYDRGQLLN